MRLLLFFSLLAISLSAFGHDRGNPHEGTTMRHAESGDARHLHEYLKNGEVVLRIWATQCWKNGRLIRDFTADDAKDADCDDEPTPTPDPPPTPPPITPDPIVPDPIPEPVPIPPTPEPEPIPDIPSNDPPPDPPPIQQRGSGESGVGGFPKDDNRDTSPPPPDKIPIRSKANDSDTLLVTEYMMRDFCGFVSDVTKWIEVYNTGNAPVNLKDYTLEIFAGRSATQKTVAETLTIGEIQVQPKEVVLLANKPTRPRNSTVPERNIWVLNNKTNLKHGWRLKDPDGNLVVEVFNPVLPPHQPTWRRVSHHRYKNTLLPDDYENTHYHGHPNEISTAGVHDFQPPKAPSLLKPMQIRKWVDLKKTQ